jgi:hypothetical protein
LGILRASVHVVMIDDRLWFDTPMFQRPRLNRGVAFAALLILTAVTGVFLILLVVPVQPVELSALKERSLSVFSARVRATGIIPAPISSDSEDKNTVFVSPAHIVVQRGYRDEPLPRWFWEVVCQASCVVCDLPHARLANPNSIFATSTDPTTLSRVSAIVLAVFSRHAAHQRRDGNVPPIPSVPRTELDHEDNPTPPVLRLLANREPPTVFGFLRERAFMSEFDLRMGYSPDANVRWTFARPLHEMLAPSLPIDQRRTMSNRTQGSTATVAWVASNCRSQPRIQYTSALMKFIPVDAMGDCLRNVDKSAIGPRSARGSERHASVLRPYKFHLAFENSRCGDYLTEKLWDAWARGNVPVVLGGTADVAKIAPAPNSFIDASTFTSPSELAVHLQKLDADDEAFARMLEWKQMPVGKLNPQFVALAKAAEDGFGEELCRAIPKALTRPRSNVGAGMPSACVNFPERLYKTN